MRINKFIAQATGLSRRAADAAIDAGRILVNDRTPEAGQQITEKDSVTLDGQLLTMNGRQVTILLNKPVGFVCSRDGQGSRTIYELLPPELQQLKPAGRLDKDSSGLLLMTTDGQLAYQLTHPKFQKLKKYKIAVNKDLTEEDYKKITTDGVMLEDGVSRFSLAPINTQRKEWKVEMQEGRNRQIRRTFEALGYSVVKLHRTHFGPYTLGTLAPGDFTRTDAVLQP